MAMLRITFRDFQKNAGLEDLIRKKFSKLEGMCPNMSSASITVERPRKRQRTGNPYQVKIEMHIPPKQDVVVRQEATGGNMHEPLEAVLRDVFNRAERQLRKVVEKRRGDIKTHPEQEAAAVVVKLFNEEGYGFIRSTEGREIYFHRNSVLNREFDRLKTGTAVRFVEAPGEKGPQASTVEIIDKPGVRVSKSPEPESEPPMGWGD